MAGAFNALDARGGVMEKLHQGIRIDRIPAEGLGGLIFAIGSSAIFLLAFPGLRPIAVAATIGGLLLAPVLHRLYR